MRLSFPKTVLNLMDEDDRIIVLLGDIGVYAFKDVFEKYPSRCFNVGILEQSMVSIAAGLAMSGFIPIVHTISPFLVARAYEQIRDDFGFQNLKGTFVGVDVHSTNPNLGLTHSCPEDTSLMSHVPKMNIYIPESPEELSEILENNYNNLNYIRIK